MLPANLPGWSPPVPATACSLPSATRARQPVAATEARLAPTSPLRVAASVLTIDCSGSQQLRVAIHSHAEASCCHDGGEPSCSAETFCGRPSLSARVCAHCRCNHLFDISPMPPPCRSKCSARRPGWPLEPWRQAQSCARPQRRRCSIAGKCTKSDRCSQLSRRCVLGQN